MPKKRSKSEERERKRRQRENQSKKMKDIIKERDAYRKKQDRNLETEDAKKKRKEENLARIKKMREKFSSENVQDRRQRLRMKRHIGTENGEEASWIRKSMKEMNIEEKRDYMKERTKWSRKTDSDQEKRKQRMSDRKRKYNKRIVKFHTKRTADLRNESSVDESDDSSNDTDEDEFPDWMDYPSDNEETIVLDPEKLNSHDMKAEAVLLNKYMKEQRKERLKTPASPMPQREKCFYEKLRDQNISQKIKEMAESGLWSIDELKVLYPDYFKI